MNKGFTVWLDFYFLIEISSISIANISNHCDGFFDAYFKTKQFYCNTRNRDQFSYFLRYMDMDFEKGNELSKLGKTCNLQKTFPKDELLPSKGPIHLPLEDEIIKSLYESDAKCAMWIFPYHCVKFDNIMNQKKGTTNDDLDLMKKIVKATIRPKFIRFVSK